MKVPQQGRVETRNGPVDATIVGEGPPLLLLHSEAGPKSATRLIESLARERRVIAPTHPGFSTGDYVAGVEDIDDLTFLYMDLIDALELKTFDLVGFSLGGWIAAELATRLTSEIASLALVSAVGIKISDRETPDIADIFSLDAEELAARSIHGASAPDHSRMTMEEVRELAQNREAAARYGWSPYMHNPKLKSRLGRIAAPTLMLWGAGDGITPPAYGEAFSHEIPDCQFETIEGAAHYLEIEQPDIVAEKIERFLGQFPATL